MFINTSFNYKYLVLAISKISALLKKHPNYDQDVQDFIADDPLKHVRFLTFFEMALSQATSAVIIFDHDLGGGTNSFSKQLADDICQSGGFALLLKSCDEPGGFKLQVRFQSALVEMLIEESSLLMIIFERVLLKAKSKHLVINHLIGVNDISALVDLLLPIIPRFSDTSYYFHDYFAICPSYTLINNEGVYCGVPSLDVCSTCAVSNPRFGGHRGKSVAEWRSNFSRLLTLIDKIVVFSDDGRKRVEAVFGFQDKIEVIPHNASWLVKLRGSSESFPKQAMPRSNLRVGVLGGINFEKGRDVIVNMLDWVDENYPGAMEVVVVGDLHPPSSRSDIFVTGRYEVEALAKLVAGLDIDVFWIPSVWPETYAYTCDEVMALGYPLVCGDIGAMPERVRTYKSGRVVPLYSPDKTFRAICDLVGWKSSFH